MEIKYKTDESYISQQYRTTEKLENRIQIHRYNTNEYKWFPWVFDQLYVMENMKILELGCGNGSLWIENLHKLPNNIEVTLSDISEGMITEIQKKTNLTNFHFKVFDAEQLPFDDAYFDIVVANHMLYHVKNIENTLSEIRRTLKTDGRFFAATIGKSSMRELKELINMFSLNIDYNPEKLTTNFGMENGLEILQPFFKKVELIEYFDDLRVPEVKPIIDYLESIWKTDNSPTDYSEITDYLEKKIKSDRFFKIGKKMGLFVVNK